MFVFRRPIRFCEIDAARLVFFARFFDYCHEALEALFAEFPGGYPRMVQERDLGIPTVRLQADFRAPLRYGDVARFELHVLRIGTTSVTVKYEVKRDADDLLVATITHVIVLASFSSLRPRSIPDDLRALFAQHLVAGHSATLRPGLT
jgi:4-hydroxybenzoyl-CoA thioesterase